MTEIPPPLTETPEIPQATRTTRIPTKPKDLWTATAASQLSRTLLRTTRGTTYGVGSAPNARSAIHGVRHAENDNVRESATRDLRS